MNWIRRLLTAVVIAALAIFCLGWAFLALPPFQDIRREIVARALSEQTGRAVIVNGGVRAVVGAKARVRVQGVVLPSETMPGRSLAELANLEFDLDVLTLLAGRIDLENLVIDGLAVDLLRAEDGTESWSPRDPSQDGTDDAPASGTSSEPETDLLAFLASHTISITDIRLRYANAVTGFDFDFELTKLLLQQIDAGTTLRVTGLGSVNGQAFSLDGDYPDGAQSTTRASFGPVRLTYDGAPAALGTGFSGPLTIEVAGIGDLLEVLRLDRVLEGSARLGTTLTWQDGVVSLAGISGEAILGKGQQLAVEGGIDNLVAALGVDLTVAARLHPEGAPPAAALGLRDFKLRSVSARIVGSRPTLTFEDLVFETNAFRQGLERVGPISVGQIKRTRDGRLAATGITLQAGPADAPVVEARGNVRDLLQLKDLDFAGRFDAPAALLLSRLTTVDAHAFGGVQGVFALDDKPGHLSINSIEAKAVDTAIWSLDAGLAFTNPAGLAGLSADIDLGLADSSTFLKALRLQPVDAGPLSVQAELRGSDADWSGRLGVKVRNSAMTLSADGAIVGKGNRIEAALTSDHIAIRDLRTAVEAVIELTRIGEALPDKSKIPLQPLVLPRATAAVPAAQPPAEGRPELQPLVLPRETASDGAAAPAAEGPERPELQPLVLPREAQPFELASFLRRTDLKARIDLKKIVGIKGITRVASELVSKGGQARLGPLDLSYGGGAFSFSASMDLLDAPGRLAVKGTTSDWDLSEILDLAGLEFEASGNMTGAFDVTGNVASARDFVRSLSGNASVQVTRGRIRTSLLELAGLGIFPWLFSNELRQGYTDLVCADARMQANGGVITVRDLVAETSNVQLVARGAVNLVKETISLRAEPRRVGRPLSRSAWPFDVSGPLSDPRFKLDVGGSRSRRADGADQMPANRVPCRPDIYQLK